MAEVTITLLVDTTRLFIDPNLPLEKCCAMAQIGGSLIFDSSGDLTNYISEVSNGDLITWNGVANSPFMTGNASTAIVNITGITATTVFGQAQLLPVSLIQGATGGTAVQGTISAGSEGDTVTYTISFNFVTTIDDTVLTSPTYSIDPKIRVKAH